MKKKGLAIIIVLVILASIAFVSFGPFAILGWETLSLTKVSFESNNAEVGGDAFLLYVIQNGAAQHAVGTFSSISADGNTAEKDFTLQLDYNEHYCRYDLETTSYTVKQIEVLEEGSTWNLDAAYASCQAYVYPTEFINEPGYIGSRYYKCFRKVEIGRVGNVVLDQFVFSTDITGEIEGESPSSKVISNDGATIVAARSVDLYGGDVHASWASLGDSGIECPSSADERVRAVYSDGSGWKITDLDAYEEYTNQYNLFNFCVDNLEDIGEIGNDWSDGVDACIRKVNFAALDATMMTTFDGNIGWGDGDFNSGTYELDIGAIKWPEIVMRIKASRLGIFVPVGEPEIRNLESSCFESGKDGYVDITIRNNASVRASFDINVNCPSPFTVIGGATSTIQLDGGVTGTKTLGLSADTSGSTVRKTCSVTVSDHEYTASSDSGSFTACAGPVEPVCREGEIKCFDIIEKQCVGGSWENTGTGNCESDHCGNKVCEVSLGETEESCPADCGGGFPWRLVMLIGGIVFTIFGIVMSVAMEDKQGKKAKLWLFFTLAGVVALAFWFIATYSAAIVIVGGVGALLVALGVVLIGEGKVGGGFGGLLVGALFLLVAFIIWYVQTKGLLGGLL